MTNVPSQPPTVPTRFEIGDCIGRGAFGAVYRARQLGEHGFLREVVLKVAHATATSADLQRLRDEAKVLALVHHRAIVQVTDLVAIEGRQAIVMEYVDGPSLGQVMATAAMPWGPVLEIASEIASALHVAATTVGPHGRPLELLHRDVKPENILVTAAGAVKLLDFGIARATFDAREAVTGDTRFGSLAYMSPERIEDGQDGAAADVYGLGLAMCEVIVGRRFGRSSARAAQHETYVQAVVEALEEREVPDEVRALLVEMLSYLPDARPSAREVERRCSAHRGGEWLRDWAERVVPSIPRQPAVDEFLARGERTVTATPIGSPQRLAAVGVVAAPAKGLAKEFADRSLEPDGQTGTTIIPDGAEAMVEAKKPASPLPLAAAVVAGLGALLLGVWYVMPPAEVASPTAAAVAPKPVVPKPVVPGSIAPKPVAATPRPVAPAPRVAPPAPAPAVAAAPTPVPAQPAPAAPVAPVAAPATSRPPATPRPAPAPPRPAPAPAPIARPAPSAPAVPAPVVVEEAPAAALTGVVSTTGGAKVVLVDSRGGRFTVPGQVPVALYTAEVTFSDGRTSKLRFSVPANANVRIDCDGATGSCAVKR